MTGRHILLICSSPYAIASAIVFHGAAVSDNEGAYFIGACGVIGLGLISLILLWNSLFITEKNSTRTSADDFVPPAPSSQGPE